MKKFKLNKDALIVTGTLLLLPVVFIFSLYARKHVTDFWYSLFFN